MKKVTDALQGIYKYYKNRLKTSVPYDYFPSCDDSDEKLLTDEEEFNKYMEPREKLVEKKSDEEPHSRLEIGAQFDVLDYWKLLN